MEKLKQIQPKVYWMALVFCLATAGVTALAGYAQLCTSKDDHGACSGLEDGDCNNQRCTKTVTPKQECRDNLWYYSPPGGTGDIIPILWYEGGVCRQNAGAPGDGACHCEGSRSTMRLRPVPAICS